MLDKELPAITLKDWQWHSSSWYHLLPKKTFCFLRSFCHTDMYMMTVAQTNNWTKIGDAMQLLPSSYIHSKIINTRKKRQTAQIVGSGSYSSWNWTNYSNTVPIKQLWVSHSQSQLCGCSKLEKKASISREHCRILTFGDRHKLRPQQELLSLNAHSKYFIIPSTWQTKSTG